MPHPFKYLIVSLILTCCTRQCGGVDPVNPPVDGGSGGTYQATGGSSQQTGGTYQQTGGTSQTTGGTSSPASTTEPSPVCPAAEELSPPPAEVIAKRQQVAPRHLPPRHRRHPGRARSVYYAASACYPFWQCPRRPLNQLNDGSCTGDTGIEMAACAPVLDVTHYSQSDALLAYQGGTCIDNQCAIPCSCQSCKKAFCPATHTNDVGSYGSSVLQWMVDVAWLKGYVAADDLASLKAGMSKGTCAIGVDFYNSEFNVDSSGRLVIDKKWGIAGGHDMIGVRYDAARKRFTLRTSWGMAWWCKKSEVDNDTAVSGDGCGYAYIDEDTLQASNFDADCVMP